MGHQIAIADYSTDSDLSLIWLDGVGLTEPDPTQGIYCETYAMASGVGIEMWRSGFTNNKGIVSTFFITNTGEFFMYGV
jgi:hypothetical protein